MRRVGSVAWSVNLLNGKSMRTILVALVMLFGALSVTAQQKIVDKSARRAPKWVDGTEQNYIITSAISSVSLEDAKRLCLESVKTRIIEAVAQNVTFSAESTMQQTSGDSASFQEDFKSTLTLNSANVPFISGVSPSRIEDSYWKVMHNKASDQTSYYYAIKYPLPSVEIKSMIYDFENRDAQMMERYHQLEQGLESVESLEQITDAIAACGELESYFFDQTRRSAAQSLKAAYKRLFDRVTIVTLDEQLGEATLGLMLDGREISSAQQPLLMYDKDDIQAARIMPKDGKYELTYDYQFCEQGLPYTFVVRMKIGPKSVEHRVNFTYTKSDPVIQPVGEVILTADRIEGDTIKGLSVRMRLRVSDVGEEFVVRSLVLNVPGVLKPIVIDDLNELYAQSDVVVLKIDYPGDVLRIKGYESGSSIKMLRGEITLSFGTPSQRFEKSFALSFSSNW